MNYTQKLEIWFKAAQADGLQDIKFFLGESRDTLLEDAAREVFEAVTGQRDSYSLTTSEL